MVGGHSYFPLSLLALIKNSTLLVRLSQYERWAFGNTKDGPWTVGSPKKRQQTSLQLNKKRQEMNERDERKDLNMTCNPKPTVRKASVVAFCSIASFIVAFRFASIYATTDDIEHGLLSGGGQESVIKGRKQPSQQQQCRRHCPKRINKIYYSEASDGAGIGDRATILWNLAQLAGYLCAELDMPPPRDLLNPIHNDGEYVSPNVQWSDLYNLTFVQNNTMAIREHQFEYDFESRLKLPVYHDPIYKDWLHAASTKGKMRVDFEMLQNFSWQQSENLTTGFVWEIHGFYFQSDLREAGLPELSAEIREEVGQLYSPSMRPYYKVEEAAGRGSCLYTHDDTRPSHLKVMEKLMERRIRMQSSENSIFGSLHLRRGDSIDVCDTSLEALRQYLACSLNGTESLGRNITLLMTTDEKDVGYRRDVLEIARDYTHVSILDADEIVLNTVTEAIRDGVINAELHNNFYIFEIEEVLRNVDSNFVQFHLIRRRSKCKDCVKISKRLNKNTN